LVISNCAGWKELTEDRTIRPSFCLISSTSNGKNLAPEQQSKALWNLFKHRVKFQVSRLAMSKVTANRSLHNFLQGQHSLTSVTLRNCKGLDQISICDTIASASGNTLTHLDLSDSLLDPDDLPQLLQSLPSLTILNVSNSFYNLSKVFHAVATHATQLRVLESYANPSNPQQALECLGRSCTDLTRLVIGADHNLGHILTHCLSLQELAAHAEAPPDRCWRLGPTLPTPHPRHLLSQGLRAFSFSYPPGWEEKIPLYFLTNLKANCPSLESLRVYCTSRRKKRTPGGLVGRLRVADLEAICTPALRVLEISSSILKSKPLFRRLGDAFFATIAEKSPNIERLYLGRTSIGDEGVQKFFEKVGRTIKSFHLESEKVTCLNLQSSEDEGHFLESLEVLKIQRCPLLERVSVRCKYLRKLKTRKCRNLRHLHCESRILTLCHLRHTGQEDVVVRVSGGVEKVRLRKSTLGEVDIESNHLRELRIEECSMRSSCSERPLGLTIIHPHLRVLEVDVVCEVPALHVQCPGMIRMVLSDRTLRHLRHIVLRDMEYLSTDTLELRMKATCPPDATKEIIGCGGFVDWDAVD